MLHSPSDATRPAFPHVGALCFRRGTAEPAVILRRNADDTVLLQRRRTLPSGATVPLEGASANTTVPLAEVFADRLAAIGLPRRAARQRGRV